MRLGMTVLILLAGMALSVGVWIVSGGRFAFVFLPLVLGMPLLWRRRFPWSPSLAPATCGSAVLTASYAPTPPPKMPSLACWVTASQF